MNSIRFIYDKNEKTRLDLELASRIPDITRSQISALLSLLKVNGKDTKLSYKLHSGDNVVFEYREKQLPTNKPENIALEIVYEDENVIVVNKTAQLTTHPCETTPHGTLVNALNYYRLYVSDIKDEFATYLSQETKELASEKLLKATPFASCNHSCDPLRLGIVHRLDKDTTGLIITARNTKTAMFLQNEFKAHRVKKCYLALLDGKPKNTSTILKTSICRSKKDGRKFIAYPNLHKGRLAISRFRILKTLNNISLVKWRIYTGRTHQIRVHAAYLGTPLLQDPLYNKKYKNTASSFFLHAYKLELDIAEGVHKVFKANIPTRFKKRIKE